ncbi:MAG: hypothetical protein K0S74_1010 [Chlamydiales bacterium]|jgi:hypothetical protein|nr:hypothetical protein [Chlamydiales bacterium]
MQVCAYAKSFCKTVANIAGEIKSFAKEMKTVKSHAQKALQGYAKGSFVYSFLSSNTFQNISAGVEVVSATVEKASTCSYKYFKNMERKEAFLKDINSYKINLFPLETTYIAEYDMVSISPGAA